MSYDSDQAAVALVKVLNALLPILNGEKRVVIDQMSESRKSISVVDSLR